MDPGQNLTQQKQNENTRPETHEHDTSNNHIRDGEDTRQVYDQNDEPKESPDPPVPLRWADETLETEQPTKNDAKRTRKTKVENNIQKDTQRNVTEIHTTIGTTTHTDQQENNHEDDQIQTGVTTDTKNTSENIYTGV